MRTRRSLRDRLYRALLRLFPGEFRGDFGDDMASDFRDQHDASRQMGRAAVARLWWRTVPGLIATAARTWAGDFRYDARFALRAMRRTPAFTAAAVLMLAMGTGANAAMFSVIDTVMLRSSFVHPDRLALIREQPAGKNSTAAIPKAHLGAIAESPVFAAVGALTLPGRGGAILTGIGEPHRLNVECVTAGVFQALEAPARLGRTFSQQEDRPGSAPVVVVSQSFWQRELGSRADAIGQAVTIGQTPLTIVGVMPEHFHGPFSRNGVDAWVPLGPGLTGPGLAGCEARGALNVFARVRDGLSLADAEAQLNASSAVATLNPHSKPNERTMIQVTSLEEQTFSDVRGPLYALLGTVVCVLLIACANVANLQLERIVSRRRELAVRLALGASRSRVVRQTLTENLLLCLLGAAGGLVAAYWTLPLLVSLAPTYIPHMTEVRLDARVLIATFGVATLAGLALGIVPALHATSPQLAADLKEAARSTARGGVWTRRTLVVIELALSIMLLIGAALMVRTFLAVRPDRPGFDPSNKLAASIQLPGQPSVNQADHAVFFQQVLDRVRSLPGVRAVSGSTYLPLTGMASQLAIQIEDTTANAWLGAITPNYFEEMRVPIVRGRAFTADDTAGTAPVAIVNEALVRRFLPGTDAIGRTVEIALPNSQKAVAQIVGIARDTRSIGRDTRARSEIYVPYAQQAGTFLYVIASTDGTANPRLPEQIRAAVAEVRPGQVVDRLERLRDIADLSVATERFGAWLFGLFAFMALGLATVGLAAVIAWSVAQRTREIGIRVALGASRSQVVRLILKQALALAATGVVVGLAAATLATRVLAESLYGVTPLDRSTFAGCAALMLLVAALASYVPARRAARVDPLISLRSE
jgi:putative ABC transport system permease protein